jgi:colanic acid/amylovoran biosynthesis glycosyltransferase
MKTHAEVIEEIKQCDALIQPSVTATNGDTEGGAPTVLLEAQACGVPIIATEHADIPYTTIVKESALLSPERDIDQLSDNIHYLFEHPELWPQMGKRGREYVACYHDVEKEVSALENIYKKCIHVF